MSKDYILIDEKIIKGITGIVEVLNDGGFPAVGMGGTWCRNQIVSPEKYELRKRQIMDEHYNAIDRGEIQPGPCNTYDEWIHGNWYFLYFVDDWGDRITDCFTYKK